MENNRKQCVHWIIVINNYCEVDIAKFLDIKSLCTYWIMAKEVGESGTPHLQCYVAFAKKKTFASIKKIWPTCHLEPKNGQPSAASNYCKKGTQSKIEWNEFGIDGPNFGVDADFVEFGVLPLDIGVAGGIGTALKWATTKDLALKGIS